MNENAIHICMISDDNYVIPTCVAIQSILETKKQDTTYYIHIIASCLSDISVQQFLKFHSDKNFIDIITEDANSKFEGLHDFNSDAICSASISALFKFILPDIFTDLDKILYLDGDLIVKEPLDEIFGIDISEYFAAVVIDSGSIYYKHEYVKKVSHYFNSGVMLLNLKKLRDENVSSTLIEAKRNLNDSSLMDQNVFNLIFDNKALLLPIRYNFMPVSLDRSNSKWKIEQINSTYGTKYATKKELYNDCAIIHYSSKDKPWKNLDGAFSSEWISVYLRTPIDHEIISKSQIDDITCKISVIMPCFNVENYVAESLDSILNQSFQDFEIICLDDGSTDNTLQILNNYEKISSKVHVYPDINHGQGYERNKGLSLAKGKYVYFMDSDDLLESNCFELLYNLAEINNLDVIYFEGTSFYESTELEKNYPQYKTAYNRREAYPKVYTGKDLYTKLRTSGDWIVSPCLQFVKKSFLFEYDIKFPEIKIMEDNLYTFWSMMHAKRTKCLGVTLFHRRVRENSTMTAKRDLEKLNALVFTIHETIKEFVLYEKDSPTYLAIATHLRSYFKNLSTIYNQMDKEERDIINCNDGNFSNDIILLSLYFDTEQDRISQLNAKLKKAWAEKSEINKKLQITYAEKASRGVEINKLKNELETRNIVISISFSFSFIKKLRNIFRKIRNK